ncbi:MAG: preprotein translocase subunit SecD [Halococcoides sp.]
MTRSLLGIVREEWRILLLVGALVFGTLVLFGPLAPTQGATAGDGEATAANSTEPTAANSTDPTNLRYGLDLDGGTRIRAPLIGYTVDDLNLTDRNETQALREAIAEETDIDPIDVNARYRPENSNGDAIELYVEELDREAVATAFADRGYDVTASDVEEGVTMETHEQAVKVLNTKISEGGVGGGRATTVTNPATGNRYISVEVPGADLDRTRSLIDDRGVVTILAHYPDYENDSFTSMENQTVLRRGAGESDIQRVGPPQQSQDGEYWYVSVTVAEGAAEEFQSTLQETGFAGRLAELPEDSLASSCAGHSQLGLDQPYCLITVADDREVSRVGMDPGLAQDIDRGSWAENPNFRIQLGDNLTRAQQMSISLRAGALPTELDVDGGQTFTIEPSLGARFKLFGLLTGIVALFAVAGVVFLRYNRPRVAGPMVVTAAAEVYLLLAFAAGIGLSLDLSHIAGFIAVVGTGADDLIIIADEILQREGRISTGRVFKSRLWKAFWVIGAAAATTIVAMSPLAILELGDLRGFAIVTIAGVLIGVIVTRPAYGDILRHLVLDTGE